MAIGCSHGHAPGQEANKLACPTAAAAAHIAIVPSVADAVCVPGALARRALGIGVRGLRQRHLRQRVLLPGGDHRR